MNGPRRTTAPCRVATSAPERGAVAISIRSSHSLRGSSTVSSRSIIRSVCLALAACFCDDCRALCTMCLSLSVAFRSACRVPLSDHPRCIRARAVSDSRVAS